MISLFLVSCQVFTPSIKSTAIPSRLATRFDPQPQATTTPSSMPLLLPTSTAPFPSPTQLPTSTNLPTSTSISLDTQLRIFDSLWTIIKDTYVNPDFNGLNWDAIHEEYHQLINSGLNNDDFYSAMDELVYQLGDEHSYFLDPQQVMDQLNEYEGNYNYVGIGVMISAIPERQHAVILSVFTGSPAEAAGLQPRDCILSVNGTPILDENGYLRDIVRGPEGTSITLSVQTPGENPRELQIIRQQITGDYTIFHNVLIPPDGQRIGYIFLSTFMDGTVDEQVAQALDEMSAAAPLDGLILDNRMNEGGSSLVLEPILSYFTSGNMGFFIKNSEEYPLRIKRKDIDGSSEVPMVVLVGPGTASFGEIFSGILQDIGRAYLIGTITQGNVEILWGYDLEDGSQLWLANETFRPLNHPDQDWEKSGIIPDLIVPGDFDQYPLDSDPVIMAALQYLSDQY